MIAPARRWEELVAAFEWRVPEEFNFGALIDAWATDRSRLALHWEDESGRSERWTFWDVREASNRAMNALGALGVGRGDALLVMLPRVPAWHERGRSSRRRSRRTRCAAPAWTWR